jgi:hypothetical protein
MDEEKLPQQNFKSDTCWKKEKRETKSKMERRRIQSCGKNVVYEIEIGRRESFRTLGVERRYHTS